MSNFLEFFVGFDTISHKTNFCPRITTTFSSLHMLLTRAVIRGLSDVLGRVLTFPVIYRMCHLKHVTYKKKLHNYYYTKVRSGGGLPPRNV